MGREFKPGDLALIKQCKTWPEAVGRCVELLEKVPQGVMAIYEGRKYENCSSGDGWIVSSELGFPTNSAIFGLMPNRIQPVALFSEHLLMPLKGDEQPAQVRQAERVS